MTLVYAFGGLTLLLFGAAFLGWLLVREPNTVTELDVIRAIKKGQKLKAMRWYRRIHGVGVKEAKEAIERFMKAGDTNG